MNQLITNYLNNYCSLKNPGFAVLIRGKWGTGKTFFIRKFISAYDSKAGHLTGKDSSNFIYVSLNGAQSSQEIDSRILSSIHPVLNNPLFSHLISGAKFSANFKPAVKPIVNAIYGFLEKAKKDLLRLRLSLLRDAVLIFDDLERCSMPINASLAYINMFVEHGARRVIILGNEEEIEKADAGKSYSVIKEKVIGQTFQVSSDLSAAYEIFIGELHDEGLRNLLIGRTEFVSKLSEKLGFFNLRALRQAVKTFEYLYLSSLKKYASESTLLENIFEIFMYLTTEAKSGLLTPDNLSSAYNIFKYKEMGIAEYRAEQEKEGSAKSEKEILSDYYVYQVPFLLHNSWKGIIINGVIDPQKIESEIEVSDYFSDKRKKPLSRILHDLRTMTNEEFESIFSQVEEDTQKGNFESPGEILRALDSYLWFLRTLSG